MKSIVIGLLIVAIVAVHAFLLHPPGGWRAWWARRPRLNEEPKPRPRRHIGSGCVVSVGVEDHGPYDAGWKAFERGEERNCPGYDAWEDEMQWYDGYDDAYAEWRKAEGYENR